MRNLCVTCGDPLLFDQYRKAGADEVILAYKDSCFSPLHPFDRNETVELIVKAHESGLRCGILMNRLFHEDSVFDAQKAMGEFIEAGADSIIFADTALAYEALKKGFMDRMVYQPETMMTSSFDAKVWSESGVQAVMISSLLTKEEVMTIALGVQNAGINIHGYQMMSVSARPLLSAYAEQTGIAPFGNRNGLYLVEEKREGRMPVYENSYSAMIFTDYIQESFDELPSFIEAGAKRFVIDGWHLEKECVLETIALYRALLDAQDVSEQVSSYREKYHSLPLSAGYYEQKTVR